MSSFNFHIPTKIIFGDGKICELKHIIRNVDKNIMIITDKAVRKHSGAVQNVETQLSGKTIIIIDEIEENPSVDQINVFSEIATKENIDLIIGIGGGSSMDAAKGIALLANNPGCIEDYLEGTTIKNEPLTNICIPTSSGTGSEVTPYAIFTNLNNKTKGAVSHPGLFPKYSIIDPELTWSMPEEVIINTGFDALTHCLEAYLSTETFELNDQLALSGINIVIENLENASKRDKPAMNNMAYASMLGGICIAHASTILLHIMAYPLTVYYGIPHGRANAILLSGFMNFMKRESYVPEKVDIIEKLFLNSGDIRKFIRNFSIPLSCSELDIDRTKFSIFAKKTISKADINITPALVTEEKIINIYKNLY